MTDRHSIKRLLIANRGEIAVRIARACRPLHITAIAVYADSDRHSLHCRVADESVALPGSLVADTYLNMDAVLQAAQRSGADAVHPGYGFLAENAEFARRCRQAGLIFVGPDAGAIDLMGCKRAARTLVQKLNLPVIPGYHGADQSLPALSAAAEGIGYPLLIKASAGGGGVGMRVVAHSDDFAAALPAARNEARRAFGDDGVLLERYFDRVRHIEIQLLADAHGNCVYLGERDCSLQRRRQKVIEEAPAVGVDAGLRQRLGEAALKIARAVNYAGAGTVEFLLPDRGGAGAEAEFYFLEMNTRLQVEHAVTEAVTGIDIVTWQLRIAAGEQLAFSQREIGIEGHAIECRWYAEDPDRDFSPQTGAIEYWRPHSGAGLRVDSGICAGQVISSYYDPLLARLIVHAADRPRALQAMVYSLERSVLLGPVSNQFYLRRVLQLPAFAGGAIDTRFLQRHVGNLGNHPGGGAAQCVLMAAALAYYHCHYALSEYHQRSAQLSAVADTATIRLLWFGQEAAVRIAPQFCRAGVPAFQVDLAERSAMVEVVAVEAVAAGVDCFELVIDGHRAAYTVSLSDTALAVHSLAAGSLRLPLVSRFSLAGNRDQHSGYRAPMPGRIIEVKVAAGQRVERGAILVVMESMKMESAARAATAGVVEEVFVSAGDSVEADTVLVQLRETEVAL